MDAPRRLMWNRRCHNKLRRQGTRIIRACVATQSVVTRVPTDFLPGWTNFTPVAGDVHGCYTFTSNGFQLSTTRRRVYSSAGEAACQPIGRRARRGGHRVCASRAGRHAAAARVVADVRLLVRSQTCQALAEGDPSPDGVARRRPRPRRADRVALRQAVGAERQGMFPGRCPRAGAVGARPRTLAAARRQSGEAAGEGRRFCGKCVVRRRKRSSRRQIVVAM